MSHGCSLLIALVAFSLVSITAASQENTTSAQNQNESTIEGTVASVTRQTFVVRTTENQFYLFTFNRYTDKPQSLPVGGEHSRPTLLPTTTGRNRKQMNQMDKWGHSTIEPTGRRLRTLSFSSSLGPRADFDLSARELNGEGLVIQQASPDQGILAVREHDLHFSGFAKEPD